MYLASNKILLRQAPRFARNREDSIIYKSLLRKQGVQLISINEPLEDTPSGKLLEGIIEVIDEFYSANLAQDVVRGMRESASRGFYVGGPVPYGYRRVKVKDGETLRTKLEPDPRTAPVVERIFRECLSGHGLQEITKGFNRDALTTRTGKQWGTTSVYQVLQNEASAGVFVWDRRRRRQIGSSDSLAPVRVEGAWPAIIDSETFQQAKAKLAERAPKVSHPRVVHSEYILSGMIRCKECGTALIGHAVKSGKFFYYMCGNARRKGRDVCKTPLLPKDRIERFIVDRIKRYILTEQNLEELVRLTNEELNQDCDREKEKLRLLETQITEVENRLGKLYDALETGEFKGGELAPRIKALFQKKEELLDARAEAEEALRLQIIELADPEIVRSYVKDLKQLLEESQLVEKKAFLKSFVERIEVGESDAKVVYTIPMPPNNLATETVGVLPIIQNGSLLYGSTIYSLSIRAMCQAANGPVPGDPREIMKACDEAQRSYTGQGIYFGGVLNSIKPEDVSLVSHDWSILPASVYVRPRVFPKWQYWRGYQGVQLPAPFLASDKFSFRCEPHSIKVFDGATEIGSWQDWTDGITEEFVNDTPHSHGWALEASWDLVEKFARRSRSTLGWICELKVLHREHEHESFREFSTYQLHGTTNLVLPS